MRLALHFNKELPDLKVKYDAEFVSGQISLELFNQACELYKREGNNKFYPNNIQEVINIVKKPVSHEDIAQNLSSKLIQAVIDHGYTWTNGSWRNCTLDGVTEIRRTFKGATQLYLEWDHAALEVFGPIGLTIVSRYGGWPQFCEIVNDSPDGVVRQQIAKLATSLMNTQERTGSFELPHSKESVLLPNVVQLLKPKEVPK